MGMRLAVTAPGPGTRRLSPRPLSRALGYRMAVDQLLRKNFWIVVLPMIAIAALRNASAVTQLVGTTLAPDEKTLSASSTMAARVAPLADAWRRTTSAEPILGRNPFDSSTGPLHLPLGAAGVAGDGIPVAALDASDPSDAPTCDGVRVLVIAASSDPEWSFAAFSAGDEGRSVMRRRGGEVEGKTVHFVGSDRVWMQNRGALCQAQLFPREPAKVATPAPELARPSRGGAKPLDPSIANGIQKISPTEFNIDRGVVEKILENQPELMGARIVPEQENGRVVGIRMFGVRPDTLLGTLGMQNGDRLETINGFDMASPEETLEAYARLRTADKLTVSLYRAGQKINLDYNIK
jgi:general secretion pathway protein C